MSRDVFESLAQAGVVPVVEITDVARGVELARTLLDAGLPVMEVTLRTPVALEAIRVISADVEGFLIGAGTLLTPAQLEAAGQAGAHFAVSPGFSAALASAAATVGLPFVPGTATATEVLAAADSGHTHLKFFPAEQAGGAATIGALAAPFASLGIRFMPTGGIRPRGLNAYLALTNVFAVGGTWIAPRDAITEGQFGAIADAARAAVSAVATFRAGENPETAR